jgi:hypothetical protein
MRYFDVKRTCFPFVFVSPGAVLRLCKVYFFGDRFGRFGDYSGFKQLRTLWKTSPNLARIMFLFLARIGLMGGKQLGFWDYEQSTDKKQNKREKFLAEMEQCGALAAVD